MPELDPIYSNITLRRIYGNISTCNKHKYSNIVVYLGVRGLNMKKWHWAKSEKYFN